MDRLADLKPDRQNPRRHGERNVALVRDSIAGDGFGRSLLLANDGTIIAGNATARAAAEAGLDRVRVIETDGTEVVALKRTDVAPDSPAFRRLSVSDNRGAELAEWDAAILAAHAEAGTLDPAAYWDDDEFALVVGLLAPAPTLDELATRYGEYDDSVFWPEIRLKVPPETYERYAAVMQALAGTTDAERFARLLELCDGADPL